MEHNSKLTDQQYEAVRKRCRTLFENKMKDYGTSWRIMRMTSITDQLYIKAKRIRSIEIKGTSKVEEGIEPEFIALVNYAYVALIQLSLARNQSIDLPHNRVLEMYSTVADETFSLMQAKNHDYGEAWRSMRISSLTDLILMKIHRIKQIEDNEGKTLVSEGVKGSYADIANYSIFALIKMSEQQS